jgi:CO dehydrogenase/acetyl-CoA synthase alpha subunit
MSSLSIRRPGTTVLLAAVGLVVALVACSDEDRDDALDDVTELAVRNFAALQGSEQFKAAGYEIDDDGLSCTASVGEGGRTAVEVECTGTTVDGGDAVLNGVTSEIPGASITELEGDWTATVDGEQVFATDELGG